MAIANVVKIDLDGPKEIYTDITLSTGDANAYGLVLEFYRGGALYDITGCSLAVYAMRPGAAAPIPDVGTVQGGKGYYVIKPSMYAYEGTTRIEIVLTGAGMHAVAKVLHFPVRGGFSAGGGGVADEQDYSVLGRLIQQAQAAAADAGNAARYALETAENINICEDGSIKIGEGAAAENKSIAIGDNAVSDHGAVAIGYNADGYESGVAAGYQAHGSSDGVAIGYNADGYENGVAVGYQAYGSSGGVAIGYNADGYECGVAVGGNATTNDQNRAIAKGYGTRCKRWNEEARSIDVTSYRHSYSTVAWYGLNFVPGSTELFLGGTSGQRCAVPQKTAFVFKIYVIAINSACSKAWEIKGAIWRKGAGAVELLGEPTVTVLGESDDTPAWYDISVSADTENNALKLTGTADISTSWTARGELTEVVNIV